MALHQVDALGRRDGNELIHRRGKELNRSALLLTLAAIQFACTQILLLPTNWQPSPNLSSTLHEVRLVDSGASALLHIAGSKLQRRFSFC